MRASKTPSIWAGRDKAFEDPSESVGVAYRYNGEGKMVLVRPDLYVDYVGPLADVEGLSGYMQQRWLAWRPVIERGRLEARLWFR
jgi:hypothetical protein